MADNQFKPYALGGARADVEGGHEVRQDDPFFANLNDEPC